MSPCTAGLRARRLPFLALALLAACIGRPSPRDPADTLPRRWAVTLDAALGAARDGRYGDADRTIAEFEGANRGSRWASEAVYWRALLMLAPDNRTGSPRQVVELLDRYIGTRGPQPRLREAELLRRIAGQMRDSMLSENAEVEKLKEELAKVQEELERIKKRLAQPRP